MAQHLTEMAEALIGGRMTTICGSGNSHLAHIVGATSGGEGADYALDIPHRRVYGLGLDSRGWCIPEFSYEAIARSGGGTRCVGRTGVAEMAYGIRVSQQHMHFNGPCPSLRSRPVLSATTTPRARPSSSFNVNGTLIQAGESVAESKSMEPSIRNKPGIGSPDPSITP